MLLCDRLRSLKLGQLEESNMSSKSRSLQLDRSSSLRSHRGLPCVLEVNISSVSLPEKVSLASICSWGSMEIPSRTLSLRKWKIQ